MYKDLYQQWLSSGKLTKKEVKELLSIKDDEKEIEYRFAKDVEFGTAGMRGLLGLGTNMLNVYTVRRATQALAEYIKSLGEDACKRGVAISFDTRFCSDTFAKESAKVLAGNGINAYLFDDVRPVPMLSFAVRHLNAIAGIMITASHNPKEYNGYKVYGEDGAQMSPEATAVVVEGINKIGDCLSDKILIAPIKDLHIVKIGKEVDEKYYEQVKALCLSEDALKQVGKTIKLVYTPVHGSGYVPVTTMLSRLGIKATLVKKQLKKDSAFSTVKVPNPEYKETLSLGIELADKIGADVVFGTDPDCDRLGVAVRNLSGEFEALSGNEVGILLLDYILLRLTEQGKDLSNGFVVKSFVSTSMAKAVCDAYGVELIETPVGFKFIGEQIKLLDDTGKKEYIFGFEESCGYLRGTHARDKDAVIASMLFAELVCYYKTKEVSVYDRLQQLYAQHGYYLGKSVSIGFKGLNAMAEMNAVVDAMKIKEITSIGGIEVEAIRDYSVPVKKCLKCGKDFAIDIPACNCVYYELAGGGFVCLRPSGTEPKLKIYYTVKGEGVDSAKDCLEKVQSDFENYIK